MRSWIGATTSPGSQVTIAQECTDEPSAPARLRPRARRTRRARVDGRVIQTGFLPVSSARHS